MNRDTVTGLVGATILVVAMIGVFQYERTIGAARAGVEGGEGWELTNLTGSSLAGSVTPGGAAWSDTANVSQQNLTMVTFTITWSGGGTLSANVQPPEGAGNATEAEGSSGRIVLEFPIANAQPSEGAPSLLGIGDWLVSVAPMDAPGPASGVPVVGAPTPVDFTIAVTFQAWEPTAAQS